MTGCFGVVRRDSCVCMFSRLPTSPDGLSPPLLRSSERTDEELLLLEEVLIRMKFVQQLTLEKRLDLCRIMGHFETKSQTKIFSQGDVGDKFYIILHGGVNVLIEDPDTGTENVVATLYGGDSFGELALLQEGNTRAASIVAREDSEFLTIDRKDYNSILRDVNESQISEKVNFLREMNLFKNVAFSTVQSVAYVLSTRDYPRNAIIARQGMECEDIYLVESGGVKLVREVEDRALLRQSGVLEDGPGALLDRFACKGSFNSVPPAPPGFGNGDSGLPLSPEGGMGSPESLVSGANSPQARIHGEYGEGPSLNTRMMQSVNIGDKVAIGEYAIEEGEEGTPTPSPAANHPARGLTRLGSPPLRRAKRSSSVIDTGLRSPGTRSEAAAKAGLGRLFLEVGRLNKYDYFGDTVLRRKTKQPCSVITTTSTRCYVLNKWDLLRRVDDNLVERLQGDYARKTVGVNDDSALVNELPRSQEWVGYRNSLVDDIVTAKKSARNMHAR